MIISNIKSIKNIEMNNLPFAQLYMYPIDLSSKILLDQKFKDYENIVNTILDVLPNKIGTAFITIDSKIVKEGKTHRRPGKHVDGNYIFDWGGGWLTGTKGRILSSRDHYLQYCDNYNGGTLIISDVMACKAWNGIYKGYAKQGGDCDHIETDDGFWLEQNKLYFMNSTAIHESMPVAKTCKRTLIRITLPPINWKL